MPATTTKNKTAPFPTADVELVLRDELIQAAEVEAAIQGTALPAAPAAAAAAAVRLDSLGVVDLLCALEPVLGFTPKDATVRTGGYEFDPRRPRSFDASPRSSVEETGGARVVSDESGTEPADQEARKALGERLREARKYLGLKQGEVAEYLKIQRTALSEIEAGNRRVEAFELQRLAKLYRQPVAYFVGEDEAASSLPIDVAHLARRAADSVANGQGRTGQVRRVPAGSVGR